MVLRSYESYPYFALWCSGKEGDVESQQDLASQLAVLDVKSLSCITVFCLTELQYADGALFQLRNGKAVPYQSTVGAHWARTQLC